MTLFNIIYQEGEERLMFDRDLQEVPYDEENLPDFKIPLVTAFTMRNTESFKQPSHPQFSENLSDSFQLSLDRDIYLNNAQLIREALIEYLKNCLKEFNADEKMFHESLIFNFRAYSALANQEENSLQLQVNDNSLLNENQKKELIKNFEEFDEFQGVFNELKEKFGREICQELVYIFASLFEVKLKQFRSLIHRDSDNFLPKVQRFWGYEDEQQLFKGSFNVYEDNDYDEIKKFAVVGVEELALRIYFSGKLNFLTLREIKGDLKEGVSVADKFATLVAHLSRNIFLSLAGMAQREEDATEVAGELSLNYIEQTDTIIESLSKKIKSDS